MRLAALAKYISADELQHLDKTLEPEWRALSERAERLIGDSVPPHGASARQLASDWQNLVDRFVRHDGALRERLLAAYDNEPLLQAGAVFTPEVRDYVRQAVLVRT